MPRSPAPPVPEVRSFDELVRGVERTLIHGKLQIERATVFANWETGRLIHRHILLNQHRAGYAEQVMARLARRVGLSERVLYQCAQFHRRFQILNRRSKLGWSHYRALSQLDDDQRRSTLAATAEKRGWTAAELEDRVRQLNLASANAPDAASAPTRPAPVRLLTPRRGTPARYPVVARSNGPTENRSEGLALDLGFKIYLPLTTEDTRRLKLVAGMIVRVETDGAITRDAEATKADLFTYRAREVRVVDGDTLAVTIDLPPGREIDKKLRLRGLNCPEMDTAGGKAARRFVQGHVDAASTILLATTKPDKYDRYLADVFIDAASGESTFLNNALLETGHAVPSDGSAPIDWIA